jgi:hypothetical protein
MRGLPSPTITSVFLLVPPLYDPSSAAMFLLLTRKDSCCGRCESQTEVAGFAPHHETALSHIVSALEIPPRLLNDVQPRLGPPSTRLESLGSSNSYMLVPNHYASKGTIIPPPWEISAEILINTTDQVLLAMALTDAGKAHVRMFIIERDSFLEGRRRAYEEMQVKMRVAEERVRNGVLRINFPSALTPAHGGPRGASHNRIPVHDREEIVGRVHVLTERGVLVSREVCMLVGGARYEVVVAKWDDRPACTCGPCTTARRRSMGLSPYY